SRGPAYHEGAHPRRAMIVSLLLFAAASVFVYSLPGLVWFAIALPVWFALEVLTGGLRVDLSAVRVAAGEHRRAIVAVGIVVVLAALYALFATAWAPWKRALYVLGGVVAVCFAASTFLALRAAPVSFDQRGQELENLAGLIQGHAVAFLGVDRFGGYWLRGTLVRSPGGYVPAEVRARRKKVWQQGLAMDFDTLS